METYTNITSSMNQPEVLGEYRSRFIAGRKKHARAAAEVCLRDESLRRFWREAIKAIRGSSRSDRDGEIFTSADLDVYLGPWDVDVKHRYQWIEKAGGDSYMGRVEPYGELIESYQVTAAYDAEYDKKLTGLPAVLNAFYEAHKTKLHNT